MSTFVLSIKKRIFIGRVVFAFIILCILYAYSSNLLLHQLQSPILKYPYVDPVYWLMHLTGIPEFFTSSYYTALSFDILLFTSCLLAFLFPLKRIFIVFYLTLFFIYFVCINTFGAHHSHAAVGLLLAPLPFLFKSDTSFSLMWQALRYYTLYLYASSFLWKLFRGTWLHWEQGILILKKNITPYLFYNNDAMLSKLYWWLLQHPSLVNTLFIIGFILEGAFIVGFFTKRLDKILYLFSFILVTGFWLLADALFFQTLVLSLTLVKFEEEKKAVQLR